MHLHSTGWTKASIDKECNLDFLDPRFGLKLRGVLSQNYLDNSQPSIFSSFSSITSHGGKKKTTHNILKKELLDASAKGNIVLLRR